MPGLREFPQSIGQADIADTQRRFRYNVAAGLLQGEMRMRETEIKILEVDRGKVEKRLRDLGARKVFDDEIRALYYDDAGGSVKRRKDALRLRREGNKAVLTYKSHVGDRGAKVRDEREVHVSDFDTTRSILESLGFSVWLEMKKHRTSYRLRGGHFEFDKYSGEYEYIPEFLEIEAPDIEAVRAFARLLGFTPKDCKPWDAVRLAKYYSARKRGKE
jgi:predicted adenylyl cyclase CyaB